MFNMLYEAIHTYTYIEANQCPHRNRQILNLLLQLATTLLSLGLVAAKWKIYSFIVNVYDALWFLGISGLIEEHMSHSY